MEEIKETIVQALDKQGVLATLKAQLRACVFAVVEEQDGKTYGTDLERRANNPQKAKLFGHHDGTLLASLIREFLEWTHMTYALKVFEAETGIRTGPLNKDSLRHELALDHAVDEPLLLSVLRAYMTHADPAASPKISAKSKSSITAKPGGHTVNIPAPAMQGLVRDSSEPIKAIHHATPDSVPTAAAAAAAMHAASQHPADLQHHQSPAAALHSRSDIPKPSSGPAHSPVSASQSHLAPPGETPQVSPRQHLSLAIAPSSRAQPPETRSASNGNAASAAATTAAVRSSPDVPLIRQVAAESSSPSAHSPSTASVISEDIEFEIDDQLEALQASHQEATLSKVQPGAASEMGMLAEYSGAGGLQPEVASIPTSAQQGQQSGVQSPALTSPATSLTSGLSLSVPKEANRAIFSSDDAAAASSAESPIRLTIPTEVNRKAFQDSPSGLLSPGDNSTVYDPDSLSASRESSPSRQSSPSRHALTEEPSVQSSTSSPGLKSIDGSPMPSPAAPPKLPDLSPIRSNARLPPLAPLQARLGLGGSPNRKSAEQIRQELREQDAWFDDTDESDSVDSPVKESPQKWKVHEGLGATASPSQGFINAAFVED